PDLVNAFVRLVRTDPDYAHKNFSQQDLNKLAHQAAQDCLDLKRDRFERQHPELARLDNGQVHDSAVFFQASLEDLCKPPLNAMPDDFVKTAAIALEEIRDTGKELATMSFDPAKARALKDKVDQQRAVLAAVRQELVEQPLAGAGEGFDKARALREALCLELDNQL